MGRTSLRPWFMGNKMQFEAVACRLFLHYSYTLAQKASNYGIFCFYDKSGKDVKHNDFDTVDVIYLTNIVEGHIRKIEGFDPWKLENYCGIFCINPFSVRTKDKKDIEVYEKLLNILPNDTILFEKEHDQANQRGKEMNISVDPIFMQEYISEHYPKLI